MYIIDLKEKTSRKIPETTFVELGLKERNDIQEWIANNPGILEYSQDLLIIQKEFDGFSDTDRRLDLLALDASGNLVIIENKRDDTGKDVVWQAINYASFCSTLTKEDIIKIYAQYLKKYNIPGDAEQRINEFFDSDSKIYPTEDQKIILVAREFRKEVLSAAQWLNSKGLDITCIKFTPHKYKDEIFLDVDRVLPQEEIKDYTLKLAQKTTDAKNQAIKNSRAEQRNVAFWSFFSEKFDRNGTIFENITTWTTNKCSWIGASAGFGRGLYFNYVISENRCRVELYIDRNDKEQTKLVFDTLLEKKDEIAAAATPFEVKWSRLDEKRASRIYIEKDGFSMENKESWNEIADFLQSAMEKLLPAIQSQAALIKNI